MHGASVASATQSCPLAIHTAKNVVAAQYFCQLITHRQALQHEQQQQRPFLSTQLHMGRPSQGETQL